jgi:uncharacterized PurR-regulated membrane protein YhhQ (DUF165 family)
MKLDLPRWSPRVLLLAFAAFISIFALDVFSEHHGFRETAVALAMHLLPSLLVLLVVAIAWRRPAVGALLCFALAASYVATTPARMHWSALALIAGPLVVTSALYLWSWASQRRLRAS